MSLGGGDDDEVDDFWVKKRPSIFCYRHTHFSNFLQKSGQIFEIFHQFFNFSDFAQKSNFPKFSIFQIFSPKIFIFDQIFRFFQKLTIFDDGIPPGIRCVPPGDTVSPRGYDGIPPLKIFIFYRFSNFFQKSTFLGKIKGGYGGIPPLENLHFWPKIQKVEKSTFFGKIKKKKSSF